MFIIFNYQEENNLFLKFLCNLKEIDRTLTFFAIKFMSKCIIDANIQKSIRVLAKDEIILIKSYPQNWPKHSFKEPMCVNGCWEGPGNTVLHTLVRLTLCNACYLIIENSRKEIRSAYVVEEKLAQRRQQAVCCTPTGQGAAVCCTSIPGFATKPSAPFESSLCK